LTERQLSFIFDGWDGLNTSILHAIQPLKPDQLAFRPAPHLRSVGETAVHIAFGRIDWFTRMDTPGNAELADKLAAAPGPEILASDSIQILD
jgi:hypothetical protein